MNLNPPNLLGLARQGNSQAIAALINRSLHPKGITAKVSLEESCLQILLESAQIPDQSALTAFFSQEITNLNIDTIKTLKIVGNQRGKDVPAWMQEIQLQDSSENSINTSLNSVVKQPPSVADRKDAVVTPETQTLSSKPSASAFKYQSNKLKWHEIVNLSLRLLFPKPWYETSIKVRLFPQAWYEAANRSIRLLIPQYKEVRLSAHEIAFPQCCCCCTKILAEKSFKVSLTRKTGNRVRKIDTKTWSFPICESCDNWITRVNTVSWTGLVISFLLLFIYHSLGLLIALPLWLFFLYEQVSTKPGCCSRPVVYKGWDGNVHTFLIANHSFHKHFTAANQKKLLR